MSNLNPQLTRREVLQWISRAGALLPTLPLSFGVEIPAALASGHQPPYDISWPLVLSPQELATTVILCDLIIPADEHSPAASSVGVPAFINEWVSAPFPQQQEDRKSIQIGISWLAEEAQRRFQAQFYELSMVQQEQIAELICCSESAQPAYQIAARFFELFRNLCAGAFYSTSTGWRDLGYVGNRKLDKFDGPPPAVLKHLGIE